MEHLNTSLPADTIVYIKEELPVPYYPEFKESGYMMTLIKRLFPSVQVAVNHVDQQLIFQLSGPNNQVFEIASLVKFLTSLPDKKFGMLLKLHSRLTSSTVLIERLINTAQTITKTKVLCLDCTKTEECKYLFVPGVCGTDSQYKLQKHLNLLVEKLEIDEHVEPVEQVVEPPSNSSNSSGSKFRYSQETMLVIRGNCAAPHPVLLNKHSLAVRLISTVRDT